MKIAIPTDGKSNSTSVCVSFGRAPYYGIYDTDKKSLTFIENKSAQASGGAGIKAAQQIIDEGVNILLTPRCGEKAADVFNTSGVKMYKTEEGTAEENIQKSIKNELKPLIEIHPAMHSGGEK